jgi:transposase
VKQPIEPKEPKPAWALPKDSKVRTTAMHIIAMRISGMDDDEIAASIGISRRSISQYLYRAGKNGWLDIDNPKDRMEYQLIPQVVQNLAEMLVSADPEVKQTVTMETAKGTIFKQFGEQAQQLPPSTLVAIRIDMPPGPAQVIREETTGGLPAYIDAKE